MNRESIGLISGIIVAVSIIPYAIRTYQGKIHPNPTSWTLWTIIGLALLLTYRSSGAEANVWPAVFGFVNVLLITILLIKNREAWKKWETFEKACFAFGLVSLAMWLYTHDNEGLVQYALYIAILADTCAAIPTLTFVWRFPEKDRPFAWGLFALGYGLSIFAISEHTVANYALPLWVLFGSFFITLPLILHRVRHRVPLKDWI